MFSHKHSNSYKNYLNSKNKYSNNFFFAKKKQSKQIQILTPISLIIYFRVSPVVH